MASEYYSSRSEYYSAVKIRISNKGAGVSVVRSYLHRLCEWAFGRDALTLPIGSVKVRDAIKAQRGELEKVRDAVEDYQGSNPILESELARVIWGHGTTTPIIRPTFN